LRETIFLSKPFAKLFRNLIPRFGAIENGAKVVQIGAWKSNLEKLDCVDMRNFYFILDIFERHTEVDKLLFLLISNGEKKSNQQLYPSLIWGL
jgi:hypothetical protein